MKTLYTHFAAIGKSYRVVKYAEEDMYPNIRVLLGIGCTLPVSFAEAELSALILWLATNQVIIQKPNVWWVVVRTCTHVLTSWLWNSCWRNLYNLCYQAPEEDVPRVHLLRVDFKYTVRGQGIIACTATAGSGVWGCGEKQFATKTCLWNGQNDRKRYFHFHKEAFLEMDRCERDEIMKACASSMTEI